MKRHVFTLFFSFLAIVMAGCSSVGIPEITGPILEADEAKALAIDQFYVNGGLDDEFSSQGEFNVYLRDAGTGQDWVCASTTDGMDEVALTGVYYGGLDIHFREVDGDRPSSSARFQILVVEKDGEDCPESIGDDDDIVASSPELTFDELIGQTIWSTNGLAAVTLRGQTDEAVAIPSMAPSLDAGLILDQVSFESGGDSTTANRYYIFAEHVEDGTVVTQCQVDDSYLSNIQYGRITYAALGIPIDCFSAMDPDFADLPVRLSLWIQRSKGPEKIGETAVVPIGEIIGEKVSFTNNQGYFKFRNVVETPFSSSIVRLGELTGLTVTNVSYTETPSLNPTLEIHVLRDGDVSYSIACAGEDQGVDGLETPDTYDDLSATLVPVTGQQELFGWESVTIKFINRTDGLSCPEPLASDPDILATTTALTPSALSGRTFNFTDNDGSISFAFSSSQTSGDASSSDAASSDNASPAENDDAESQDEQSCQ
ncbi:MAG: hypothetical protein HY465_04245 [Deltaproteobacteria bacterium]|nr:hypothetical protein [Deltaproteobacteria bacterium]